MKLLIALLLLPASLLSASSIKPVPSGRTVAMGKFQLWLPDQRHWEFVSGGLRVAIEPAPCDAAHQSEGCRYDPVNNQAIVTITAPGRAPFRVETDNQASYYRLAVVRLDRGDPRPSVVIENDWGGSAGIVADYVVAPRDAGFRLINLAPRGSSFMLKGELPDDPRDLSGDGVIDFVLSDPRFSPFGCHACTPSLPQIFTVRGGQGIDMSRKPAFAPLFRKDFAPNRSKCASHDANRNGACVAYAADAARLGAFEPAMRNVAKWYERDDQWGNGTHFPAQLRAFLRKIGYID